VLGVIDVDLKEEIPEEINAMVEARQQARKNKDFAESDRIRDEVAAAGWIVEDTPNGSRIKHAS
jgi:cysteinyl-tRNA synthetase